MSQDLFGTFWDENPQLTAILKETTKDPIGDGKSM